MGAKGMTATMEINSERCMAAPPGAMILHCGGRRQPDNNSRTMLRRGIDEQLRAKHASPCTNPLQPEMPRRNLCGIEADAVVFDRKHELAILPGQPHLDLRRASVIAN